MQYGGIEVATLTGPSSCSPFSTPLTTRQKTLLTLMGWGGYANIGKRLEFEEVGRIPSLLLLNYLKLFPSSSPAELHMGRERDLESTSFWSIFRACFCTYILDIVNSCNCNKYITLLSVNPIRCGNTSTQG